jgi:AcrR family transcriptional regulator
MRADGARNRERVLEAAEAVFNAEGVAASTEEVARRAGVGIGTVFRHFPDKQALLQAVVRRRLETLLGSARSLADQAAPDGFDILLEKLIAGVASKRAVGEVLLGADAAYRRASDALTAELWCCFESLMPMAKAQGRLRDDVDLDDLKTSLSGLNQALALSPGDTLRQARIASVVIRGLRPVR